jgi:hypothetical protein
VRASSRRAATCGNSDSLASLGGRLPTARDSAHGREDGNETERASSRDAERLVAEHGEAADEVAARRADALFRDGDTVGGTRWLKIFRRIALAHRRRIAG